MSVDFVHTIEIARPSDEVFAFLADAENNPTWQGGMVRCAWTSDERLVPGATYQQEARFFGRRIDTHFQVTAYEPGRSISIESTVSTFPIQVTRSVEPLFRGGCKVTAHIRGQPTGVLKLLSGLIEKSVKKDYAKLKALLEAQGQSAKDKAKLKTGVENKN